MINEITKAQLLVLQVGRLKDAEKAASTHLHGQEKQCLDGLECARLSRIFSERTAVPTDYPIMRHLMNLESVKTYEARMTSTR